MRERSCGKELFLEDMRTQEPDVSPDRARGALHVPQHLLALVGEHFRQRGVDKRPKLVGLRPSERLQDPFTPAGQKVIRPTL